MGKCTLLDERAMYATNPECLHATIRQRVSRVQRRGAEFFFFFFLTRLYGRGGMLTSKPSSDSGNKNHDGDDDDKNSHCNHSNKRSARIHMG